MKNMYAKAALAAVVVLGGVLTAGTASAIVYHDVNGRAYYYNNWGQTVYYDTGYDSSYTYYTPASSSMSEATYVGDGGQYCREFQRSMQAGNSYETRSGTECQDANGSWIEQ